jgi:hypothetical protein
VEARELFEFLVPFCAGGDVHVLVQEDANDAGQDLKAVSFDN